MKPHVHADLIKAWADGAQIQYNDSYSDNGLWRDIANPVWSKDQVYRIKPRDFEVGAFYPAINKYGQQCLIKCTSTECKPVFRDKHEFYSEPHYHWIGEKLEIDWPEGE